MKWIEIKWNTHNHISPIGRFSNVLTFLFRQHMNNICVSECVWVREYEQRRANSTVQSVLSKIKSDCGRKSDELQHRFKLNVSVTFQRLNLLLEIFHSYWFE